VGFKAAGLFNPMTGRQGLAQRGVTADGRNAVRVALAPGETCLVRTMTRDAAREEPYVPTLRTAGEAVELRGEWTLTFVSGGPTLPAPLQTRKLDSWTDLGGADTKIFAGTAVYRLEFDRPDFRSEEVALDLGVVASSARVRINGREVAALIDAPWRVVLSRDVAFQPGRNVLEVAVTNLAANRIADLDRRNPGWKKFYNTNYPARMGGNRGLDGNFSAAKWEPRASGLLGPVKWVPLAPPGVASR
jgi:hypothetical protein